MTSAQATPSPIVEGPIASKAASQENFPVASMLLSARLRPHVMAFYAFVRLADDIADDAVLEPDQKLEYLEALDAALVAGQGDSDWRAPAAVLKRSLDETGVSNIFARELLEAFRRDARKLVCRDWRDLIDYCRYSAMPVGRYLMALHGEDDAPRPASDALCTALQILNHLQDCGDDWRRLERLYVPLNWLAAEGLTADALLAERSGPALRRVLDRVLGEVDALLHVASPLGQQMQNRRLGLEAAVIVNLATALRDALRAGDPLAERVEVSKSRRYLVAGTTILKQIIGR